MSPSPNETAPHTPAGANDRWLAAGVCLFLAAIIWLVFGQTVHHDFINFDDNTYIYENSMVQKGVTVGGLHWALTTFHASNWHPLTWFSHMLDCQFYGLKAGGHHLTNVLLHTATTWLLFLGLRQMTGFLWRSAFVAAVFSIHPLRVESVAWVAERKDVLSGLLFLLTISAYVRYVRQPWSWHRYLLVALLLVLALMAKPMVVTLPFVLLLLDYWPLKRFTPAAGHGMPWRLIAEKIPLLALSGAACAATIFAQQAALSSLSLPVRAGNAVVAYVIYLKQMIYPADLAPFYPHPESSLATGRIITALIALLVLSAVAVVCRRKQPWLLFGWLWYLGMLVPVIGILQVGLQAHADRYTYLPQIGLYLALTWLVADWLAGWRHHRLILGGLATVSLAVLICDARTQTTYWRNSETLWTHALACTTGNVTAHVNLGNALLQRSALGEAAIQFQQALQLADDADAQVSLGYTLIQQGRTDEAMDHFQRALAIKPNYAAAQNNLGDLLAQKGEVDEAMIHFQKALQIKPDYAEAHYNLANALVRKGRLAEAIDHYQQALALKPDYAEDCFNLANTLFQKGDRDAAVADYQLALKIKPDYANACFNLGAVLIQMGRLEAAVIQLQRGLQLKPGNAKAHYSLADTLVRIGKDDEAIGQYQQALQLDPDYSDALNDLAWEMATASRTSLRNGSQAVALAQRANQLAGGADLDIAGTLAAAYAEAGRFEEAVRSAQQAIELARTTGQSAQLAQLNSELKLYEAGLPFHQEGK